MLYYRATALDKQMYCQVIVLDGQKYLSSTFKVMQTIRGHAEGQWWDLKKQQNTGK